MSSPHADDLSHRVTELEIQLAHTQHNFDQLNSVVTSQAGEIDRLQRLVKKMTDQIETLNIKSESPSDPLDEKPPHY